MPQDLRLWQVSGDSLQEVPRQPLDLEQRLEVWLERDISMLDGNLLVIGRQVQTDFGGFIDLLCMDRLGDLVIVELKRDKTPRDVTAQALDYAAWVKGLSADRITDIANRYLGDRGPIEDAFQRRFEAPLPESLNQRHSMMIVASQIDDGSERIMAYLSEAYGVPINAVTFHHFAREGLEWIGRVSLLDPRQVEYRAEARSGTRVSYPDWDEQSFVEDLESRPDLDADDRNAVRGICALITEELAARGGWFRWGGGKLAGALFYNPVTSARTAAFSVRSDGVIVLAFGSLRRLAQQAGQDDMLTDRIKSEVEQSLGRDFGTKDYPEIRVSDYHGADRSAALSTALRTLGSALLSQRDRGPNANAHP